MEVLKPKAGGIWHRLYLFLFKKKCPKCKSRRTEIMVHVYDGKSLQSKSKAGRECWNCNHFWYS